MIFIFLNVTPVRIFKKSPVIKFSCDKNHFQIFTDMLGSINLPDSGVEVELMDGARTTSQLKLLSRPVLMTRKNTAMSLLFGTL